jgi:hypothetical protein
MGVFHNFFLLVMGVFHVDQAVSELVDCGCVHEVSFIPYMVNPLSVATNKSGKKRLILDLSVLNKFAKKQKFKFEDWKLTIFSPIFDHFT